jgi:CBS domain-containing protein
MGSAARVNDGRALQFLRIYNELDTFLRAQVATSVRLPFGRLVDNYAQTHPGLSAWVWEVKSFAELRNAIVHGRDFPPEVIAEPTSQAVDRFGELRDQVTRPPPVLSVSTRKPEVFPADASLSAALQLMHRKDFSQVVVTDHGELRLLSVEGVAGWLESMLATGDIALTQATIGDALEYEMPGTFLCMAADRPAREAREAFLDLDQRHRLFAILITASGEPSERALGIVTAWDVM